MPFFRSFRGSRRHPPQSTCLHLEALEDRTVPSAASTYGQLPLTFEPNVGQADASINFVAHGSGYGLALTPASAVLSLGKGGDALGLELVGGDAAAPATGQGLQAGVSNYLIGNDPSRWHTGVANYGGVKYQGVYPGVDLVYYGSQRQLEYDFDLAPGTAPSAICLRFTGAQGVSLDGGGSLVLRAAGGEVIEHAPVLYQTAADGSRQAVAGSYVLAADGTASFAVGPYDSTRPLVIDPVLNYSTYLGGSGVDQAWGVAVNAVGEAFVVGSTQSTNFPTAGPLQAANGGAQDVFVAKLNAAGTALVYSTYLGGSASEQANGVAVDAAGEAFVVGYTGSTNFPTVGPLQATIGSVGFNDAFVAKLNAAGSGLAYSTYLGGSTFDDATAVVVDAAGEAFVVGLTSSTNFPTAGPLQPANGGGSADAFVTKVNAAGNVLLYSTYLGGSGGDQANAVAVDAAGEAFVVGDTDSTNFPTASPLQLSNGGGHDTFVTKLNATGTALVYSTYLGGSSLDNATAVAVDAAGEAFVVGETNSNNFPTAASFQPVNASNFDVFVAKLNAAGSGLAYSTYLGGSGTEQAQGVAVDAAGEAFVVGFTTSTNFPTVAPEQAANGGGQDAFVVKLNAAGSGLAYSTYLGGSGTDQANAVAVDAAGNAYVAGSTTSTNFPTATPEQAANGGTNDAFLTKLATPSTHAAVFVVAAGVATDATHYTSLAAALLNVTAGGTVTVEPGALANTFPVPVGLPVTLRGDPNVPGSILPRYDLVLDASGITLNNLNLGAVTVSRGFGGETLRHSTLVSLTTVASGTGNNVLDQCTVTGFVSLTGTVGAADAVTNSTFNGDAPVLLATGADPHATIQGNTFIGTAAAQTAIDVENSDQALVANNTVSLAGGGPATIALVVGNPGGAFAQIRTTVSNNTLQTAGGRGLVLHAGNDTLLQVLVQGNDFHGNAIGVDYTGAGGTTLGSDLGGGTLGSLGGNNFRSFTVAATVQVAAIALRGVGAGAVLKARNNLFAASATPSAVVFTFSGSIDVSSPLSADRAFVQALYNEVLGRAGNLSELDQWVTALHSAGQSQGTVVHSLLFSTEALDRVINALYLRFLGRTSSAAEEQPWVGLLQSGHTLESVQAGFIASPEFLTHNNTDYVQSLYRLVLGRTGGPAELASWYTVLQQPGGLQTVATLFAQSQENRLNAVTTAYQTFLHRTPGATEQSNLANISGLDLLGLEQAVLSAPEFYSNG